MEKEPSQDVFTDKEQKLQRARALLEESRAFLKRLEESESPDAKETAELVRSTIVVLEETLKAFSPTVH